MFLFVLLSNMTYCYICFFKQAFINIEIKINLSKQRFKYPGNKKKKNGIMYICSIYITLIMSKTKLCTKQIE